MAKPLKTRVHELESVIANPRHELHVDCLLVSFNKVLLICLLSSTNVGTSSSKINPSFLKILKIVTSPWHLRLRILFCDLFFVNLNFMSET